MVAFVFRPGFHGHDIGACIRFGHGKRPHVLGTYELGNIFLFEFLTAVGVNCVGTAQRLHIDLNAQRTGCPGDFFSDDHGRQPTHFRSTVLLWNNRPEQAQLSHRFDNLFIREIMFFIPLVCERRDFLAGEITHHIPEHLKFFRQAKVHF